MKTEKKVWIHDHEVFPNFFSSILIDKDSDEEYEFIINRKRNDLISFVDHILNKSSYLIGYNSTKYDNIITNYLVENVNKFGYLTTNEITDKIYNLSCEIINSQKNNQSIYWNVALKPYLWTKHYKTVDLMSLMAFDKNRVSLKQACIAMRWYKVQDLPKPFDSWVETEEIVEIMKYNRNDVLATKRLQQIVNSEIKIRGEIGRNYGIKLWSSSRSSMADKLMGKFWEQATGKKYKDFKDIKTERDFVNLKDCLSDLIKFDAPILKELHQSIKDTKWEKGNKFKRNIIFGNSRYDILLGGLHSYNNPMIVEETDEYYIKDVDFGSYYPNLMINLKLYPEHLSNKFLVLFTTLVTQRLKAKAIGNKLVADALKIVINSVYGKLNFDYGWLKDCKASYSVTLNGQMFLLMLIEKYEKIGCKVFYANTDGLTVKVLKDKVEEFEQISKDFSEYVNIPLEFADYKKCIIRDVNNFSIITSTGELKEKGVFVRDLDTVSTFLTQNYTCSYNKPIVALALYEYFHNGISPEEFIPTHKDIHDFCAAQKIGSQFTAELHTLKNGKHVITECQKTNRYYITTINSKFFKKRKDNGRLNDLAAGHNVSIINNVDDNMSIEDYKINYNYYIAIINKIIDKLEPKQLTLF